VESDRSHQYVIGFGIGCDLVFIPVFGDDTDLSSKGDLRDNLILDPTTFIDTRLEATPLDEQ
jgi:hypothetical protein